jgi:tetratricopeptide (TPR) repeat protein
LLFIIAQAAVQSQDDKTLVEKIISAYEGFNYEETDRFLEVALKEIENFSPQDQIQIYKYAAFRKFQQGESFQTEEYFWKILKIDPTFSLDPLTTSPKILALFQKTKIEFLEDLQQRLAQMEQSVNYNPVPWRSLIFPGWEQWHRGYSVKGVLWIMAGTGCLAGVVQAVIRTDQKKQEYEEAVDTDEIRTKYDEYNRLYKSQFYWSCAFIAVWLSSHIDALFFLPLKPTNNVSLTIPPSYPGLTVTFHF